MLVCCSCLDSCTPAMLSAPSPRRRTVVSGFTHTPNTHTHPHTTGPAEIWTSFLCPLSQSPPVFFPITLQDFQNVFPLHTSFSSISSQLHILSLPLSLLCNSLCDPPFAFHFSHFLSSTCPRACSSSCPGFLGCIFVGCRIIRKAEIDGVWNRNQIPCWSDLR